MNIIRKLIKFAVVVGVIAAVVVGASTYWEIYHWKSDTAAEVTVPKGASLDEVAALLAREGVIRSPRIFALYARLTGVSGKLSAGDYAFPAGMSIADVLKRIVKGEVKRYTFTVIEGWNLDDIERMLAEKPHIGPAVAAAFHDRVRNPEYIAELGFPGLARLEGYLFPDTYVVYHPRDVDEIIKPMVRRFKQIYTDKLKLRARELGMNDHDVITLASIIEKETGREDERKIISSVFHNRLKRNIPLASDPTVIYGIDDFDGNLRRRDLERPGPYNTYLNAGLPPGPIASPGEASIKAALYPAKTPYLYFVSRNDGSHHFSATLAEHNRAVQHYQVRRSDKPFK